MRAQHITGRVRRSGYLGVVLAAAVGLVPVEARGPAVLDAEDFAHHVAYFNRMADEEVVNAIPNRLAWAWMRDNVPLFEAPDRHFEQVYYYRWWAFRKHIKHTPAGHIITEFLRPVRHAADYNALSCALGHHISEGRWLHDPQYLDEYIRFWLHSGEGDSLHPRLHQFSGWVADAVYRRWLVNQDTAFLTAQLDALIRDYSAWESERRLASGLFWQYDVADGMEESISGSRTARNVRPTINSYMFGNARAIARIARLASRPAVGDLFERKAEELKHLVQAHLWDPDAEFFKVRHEDGRFADVRELLGYTPWYFGLPDRGREYARAWRQLTDPGGFHAPFGPTTAERRHPKFAIASEGDACQWNGPSWPFATTVTLKGLANLLRDDPAGVLTERDYFTLLETYTRSHRLKTPDGQVIPWIDENLHPFTGVWWARTLKLQRGRFDNRGAHYNHSGYADLVLTGLAGLRPRADDVVEIDPLLPDGTWDWFCVDNIPYHGRRLTILWDRTGGKYGRGSGFRVYASGTEIAHSPTLSRLTARLP